MRIGFGYDSHRLENNRDFILGGVKIPHAVGLYGHSDADVLTHAIIDAMIGAMAQGDIGRWFPDIDLKYKGASSIKLLEEVMERLKCRVVNIDCTVLAQKPKLSPYIEEIRKSLAKTMNVDISCVSIKAKTEEGKGTVGREELVKAYCVALIDN